MSDEPVSIRQLLDQPMADFRNKCTDAVRKHDVERGLRAVLDELCTCGEPERHANWLINDEVIVAGDLPRLVEIFQKAASASE